MGLAETIRARPAARQDLPAIRELVAAIGEEYGYVPEPETADRDLYADVEQYFQSTSLFRVLVDQEKRIVGLVGVIQIDRVTAELRKIYLAKTIRGEGWGRRLLDEAHAFARKLGCRRVILESARRLESAVRLYQQAGYQIVEDATRSKTCDLSMVLELGE